MAKEDTVKTDAPKLDIKANKTADAATDEAKIAELKELMNNGGVSEQ